MRTITCRICESNNLQVIIDYGKVALADSFLNNKEDIPKEKKYNLRLCLCNNCKHVQIDDIIDPELLFTNYPWETGISKSIIEYAEEMSLKLINYFNVIYPKGKPKVFEIASNDGTLLNVFKGKGCEILGIDPATNIAEIAVKNGVPTQADFFTKELAQLLRDDHGTADIVFARNVIPHVKEIHSVISGVETLLSKNGIGIIEFHNAGLLLEELHYDYIYHEHLFYFTLTTIEALLKKHNLFIFDVSLSPISGGSWVVYFSKQPRDKSKTLTSAQNSEIEIQYNKKNSWINFSNNAKKHADELTDIVKSQIKIHGKITAYGASARSSTLLNYCGINSDHISVIIDKNPLKHGLLTAGSNIPIVSYKQGLKYIEETEIILLLAWNFRDEIIEELRLSGYMGKFIIPLPGKPCII